MREVIGRATLYLGDCLDVMPELEPVDLVATDPPFVGLAGGIDFKSADGVGVDAGTTVGDPWGATHDWLPLAWALCEKGLMTFCTYHSVDAIPAILCPLGAAKAGLLMWNKPNAPHPSRNSPRHSAELIWLFRKGPGLDWRAINDSVITVNNLTTGCMASPERLLASGSKKAAHPTQKPVAVMAKLLGVKPSSVMDPFMGTGTTGVAALSLGIPFVGIERDPAYFDMACRRIEAAQRQGDMFATGR